MLKETYCAHFLVYYYVWGTMRIVLHALMLIKDIVFFKLFSAEMLSFSSCLFTVPPPVYYQTPLIGQLTHALPNPS